MTAATNDSPARAHAAVRPPRVAVIASYDRRYTVDSVVAGTVGIALTLIGFVAATRAGFEGPLNVPVVSVLGFTHTTTLGLVEAGVGVCLMICAASASRPASIVVGSILGIGAYVMSAQTGAFTRSLAIQSSYAWMLALAGLAVVLAALLVPRAASTAVPLDAF